MRFERQNALEKRIIFPIPLQKILLGRSRPIFRVALNFFREREPQFPPISQLDSMRRLAFPLLRAQHVRFGGRTVYD